MASVPASVREHIAKTHEAAADYHKTMAAHHGKLAKCYSSMGKAAGGSDGAVYQTISDEHDEMAKAHSAHGKFHMEAAEECAKAVEAQLSKTLVGDRFTSVAPSDAPFGIRAVTRPGQPDIGSIDKSAIPAQFRGLVENLQDEI